MAPVFDAIASDFDRFRTPPSGVPEAIRSAIFAATRVASPARILDLGAGTGRFGRAFIAAGDRYTGMDASFGMLRQFQALANGALLAQADGSQLPFPDGAFDLVLLIHVLSGTSDWRPIVEESRRVVTAGGAVVVGHTMRPESGMDGKLKRQLQSILEEMGIPWQRPAGSRQGALAWLRSHSGRHTHFQVASWNVSATAQEFLLRHRSGARFAALPDHLQELALQQLTKWAEKNFGSLGAAFDEQHSFELDVFEF